MWEKGPVILGSNVFKFSKVLSFFALCTILSCEYPNMGCVLTLETIDPDTNEGTTSCYDKDGRKRTGDTVVINNIQYTVVEVKPVIPPAPPM